MLNPSLNKSTSVGVVGFSATHQATQEGSQAPTLHAPATGKTEPWCGVEPAGARYLPQPLSAPAGEHQESAAWGRHPWVEGTLQKSSLWSRESGLPSENKKNELLHWRRQEKSSSRPLPGSGKAWGWRLPSGNGAQWAGSQLPQLRGTPLEETCFSPAAPWVWRQGLPGWEKEEIRKEIRMSQGVKGTWFRQVASRTPAGSPPGDPPLRPPTWPLGTHGPPCLLPQLWGSFFEHTPACVKTAPATSSEKGRGLRAREKPEAWMQCHYLRKPTRGVLAS